MRAALSVQEPYRAEAAQQEIEYLRRDYAWATDLFGKVSDDAHEKAQHIYKRIFAPDVQIRVIEGARPLHASSPESWAEVVVKALDLYVSTQHLIGSQRVTIKEVWVDSSGYLSTGNAAMTSYLQGWHTFPNSRVWLSIGTYYDKARFTPGVGWQIYDMPLEQVSGDARPLGTLA